MAFRKIDLTLDAGGRSQNREQRIARITSLFQSGQVTPNIATDAIRALARGEDARDIETTKPLDLEAVMKDLNQAKDAAVVAEKVIRKSQGINPERKINLENTDPPC